VAGYSSVGECLASQTWAATAQLPVVVQRPDAVHLVAVFGAVLASVASTGDPCATKVEKVVATFCRSAPVVDRVGADQALEAALTSYHGGVTSSTAVEA
jgi:hypothetical protein